MDTPQFNRPSRTLSAISPSLLSSYQWTAWNPTDVIGTATAAPGTGTSDPSSWVTQKNVAGTVTLTFAKAGKYLVSITGGITHANTFTLDRLTFTPGGTAARRNSLTQIANSGIPSLSSTFTAQFMVVAAAGDTLTLAPTLEVSGAGTPAQHTAIANVTTLYAG